MPTTWPLFWAAQVNKMDLNHFQALGFTTNETHIYLHLIEQGRANAQALAKRIGLPRSTVYSALSSLELRGLVRQEERRGVTWFRVETPDAILHQLSLEEEKLRQRQSIAQGLVKKLRALQQNSEGHSPRIEIHHGRAKVERFLFENLERWCQSILARDRSTWGYQDHTFVKVFNSWLKHAWKVMHVDAGIAGRILSNRSDIERGLKGKINRREVRILGEQISFESSTWVLGDYVIVIMTRKEPFYAFQVFEPSLANNLRELFKYLYEKASIIA